MLRYRKRPLSLQKLDALIARLPDNHPKMPQLRQQAAREQKGFNGERKLDYHLQSLSSEYIVLNDICFSLYDQKIQIDSLIITAQAIFIVEVKSFEGLITFQPELRQCYREKEGTIERFKYPITQVEAIQTALLRFLQLANLSGLPIYYFIAFSEKSTLFQVKGEEQSINEVVMYVEDVPIQMMKINRRLIDEASAPKSKQMQQQIAQHILRHREDFDKDILREFNITPENIPSGVHCPSCDYLGMERKYRSWRCKNCLHTSRTSHIKALHHYYLLFNSTITNKKCRAFLQISSRHTAKYLLQTSPNITKKSRLVWKINHQPVK